MENRELRYTPLEIRVLTDSEGVETRTIRGTAIVFNTLSQLINAKGITFYETIKPEAVTPELIATSDIVMLYNHKTDSGVLARSKNGNGTLQIFITETGVDFQFDAPNSPNGDNILESVKRGDLDSCSFAFKAKQGGEVWQRLNDVYHRTITSIEILADFSIVVNPAYTSANCNTRGLDELIEAEKVDNESAEHRQLELDNYYSNLRNIVNSL